MIKAACASELVGVSVSDVRDDPDWVCFCEAPEWAMFIPPRRDSNGYYPLVSMDMKDGVIIYAEIVGDGE